MKVLIAGAGGQVGKALVLTVPSGITLDAVTREQLDLTDHRRISGRISTFRPDAVINVAAYTAVDRAEAEPERANAINAVGVGVLAKSCMETGAKLVHVSTDYVFDGRSPLAYETTDPTNPINAYGTSKLAGERAIEALPELDSAIVRTSWVYAPWGKNFLLTMLRLMRERGSVSVVGDQVGAPTSALTLARFLWRTASQPKGQSVLHYTDAGVASWYDFAVAINEEAVAAGVLAKLAEVKPIVTREFPTAARRPAFSLLATRTSTDALSFPQPHWRAALREVLKEVKT